MGEKKQNQSVRPWYKILAVIGCVLFVVLMVVSSMGSGWITAFSAIRPGDVVTVDFTIKDKSGNPLVTSDQVLYRQNVAAGKTLLYSKQLVFQANLSSTEAMIPVPVYSGSAGWSTSFALFGGEHDAISQGLVGMRKNEQKTIKIPFTDSMTQFWSSEQLTRQGVNLTDVHVGDKLAMAVASSSELPKNATESSYSVRISEITQKTSSGVTFDFGYPAIDVKVLSINSG
jgi:hypothetical protein